MVNIQEASDSDIHYPSEASHVLSFLGFLGKKKKNTTTYTEKSSIFAIFNSAPKNPSHDEF